MNNKLLIAFAVFMVAVVLGTLFSLEWEKIELETGLTETARKEPLLAANLFLKQYNASLEELKPSSDNHFYSNNRLTLSKDSTFIIDEGALSEYPNIAEASLAWVRNGGHVVYVLSPRREQLNLLHNPLLLNDLTIVDSESPVRRRSFTTPVTANVNILDNQQNFDIYLSHQFTFDQCAGNAIKEEVSEATLICHLAVEQGYITYLPSIDLIATANLHRLDHAQFLLWLLGENNDMFYLPSTMSTHWLVSLLNWSWQIIILTLLFFIGLVWHLAMRIGLPIEPSSSSKNAFSTHIEAIGDFMIKHGHHQHLKAALVKDLDIVMEKRIVKYQQLPLAVQAEQLSKISGKEQHMIEQLLSEALPSDHEKRLHFIKSFKELRNSL